MSWQSPERRRRGARRRCSSDRGAQAREPRGGARRSARRAVAADARHQPQAVAASRAQSSRAPTGGGSAAASARRRRRRRRRTSRSAAAGRWRAALIRRLRLGQYRRTVGLVRAGGVAALVADRAARVEHHASPRRARAGSSRLPRRTSRAARRSRRGQEVLAPDHHQRARGGGDATGLAPAPPSAAARPGARRWRCSARCRARRPRASRRPADQQAGRHGDARILEQRAQRLVPARLDLAVEVDERDEAAARRLGAAVAARREADVVLEAQDPRGVPVLVDVAPAAVAWSRSRPRCPRRRARVCARARCRVAGRQPAPS